MKAFICLRLLLSLFTLVFLQAAHAQPDNDPVKAVEENFKKNLPKILALTTNNNPSIIAGPYSQGSTTKFTTNLELFKSASHFIDFSSNNTAYYTAEAPYKEKASAQALYDLFKFISRKYVAPLSYAVETKTHENLRRTIWKIRQKIGPVYYNSNVTLQETVEKYTDSFYYMKFYVSNSPATFKIREGELMTKRKLVSPGDLITLLSGQLNSRFKNLAMFAYEKDSTSFKPYVQLEKFVDAAEETHIIYNSYASSLFKGRLAYEASKNFPGADKEALAFFEEMAALIQPSFSAKPTIKKYADGKSVTYLWESETQPYQVKLAYSAESWSFPQNVGFSFTSSKEDVDRQAFKKVQLNAAGGNAAALNDLGSAYFAGIVVPKDLKKSAEYFMEAAEKGSAPGMLNNGLMYSNGYGVKQDIKKAMKWYDKALATNAPIALYRLVCCIIPAAS